MIDKITQAGPQDYDPIATQQREIANKFIQEHGKGLDKQEIFYAALIAHRQQAIDLADIRNPGTLDIAFRQYHQALILLIDYDLHKARENVVSTSYGTCFTTGKALMMATEMLSQDVNPIIAAQIAYQQSRPSIMYSDRPPEEKNRKPQDPYFRREFDLS